MWIVKREALTLTRRWRKALITPSLSRVRERGRGLRPQREQQAGRRGRGVEEGRDTSDDETRDIKWAALGVALFDFRVCDEIHVRLLGLLS